MTTIERRLTRLEDAIPEWDGEPDMVRTVEREDGSEKRLYLRRGIVVGTESTEPHPAA